MILPSASKLALAMRCQYPWHPSVRWPKEQKSVAAARGDAVHAVAETHDAATVKHDYSAGRTVEDNARLAVDALTAGAVEVLREQPLAYHAETDTARMLPKGSHRDYSARKQGELVGTVDLLVRYRGR